LVRSLFSNVVLPEPKKPVRSVMGIRLSIKKQSFFVMLRYSPKNVSLHIKHMRRPIFWFAPCLI
jgi:hypothetical protein